MTKRFAVRTVLRVQQKFHCNCRCRDTHWESLHNVLLFRLLNIDTLKHTNRHSQNRLLLCQETCTLQLRLDLFLGRFCLIVGTVLLFLFLLVDLLLQGMFRKKALQLVFFELVSLKQNGFCRAGGYDQHGGKILDSVLVHDRLVGFGGENFRKEESSSIFRAQVLC